MPTPTLHEILRRFAKDGTLQGAHVKFYEPFTLGDRTFPALTAIPVALVAGAKGVNLSEVEGSAAVALDTQIQTLSASLETAKRAAASELARVKAKQDAALSQLRTSHGSLAGELRALLETTKKELEQTKAAADFSEGKLKEATAKVAQLNAAFAGIANCPKRTEEEKTRDLVALAKDIALTDTERQKMELAAKIAADQKRLADLTAATTASTPES